MHQKKLYKNNRFKMSAPAWDEQFELPGGSYSLSYIRRYIEHTRKKYGTFTYKLSIKVYFNKNQNRITVRIKTEYLLP